MNEHIKNIIKKFYNPRKDIKSTYKNWNVLDCEELYLSSVSNEQRLQYASMMEEKTIFHTYWKGTFSAKQAFSIKSLLCTQNLDNVEVWLWIDGDIDDANPYLTELKGRIKIKQWCIDKEIIGTPFESIRSYFHTANSSMSQKDLASQGDNFRILSLYKYGGVYFDLDVMFLKDFEPLLRGDEFVYAWEFQTYANSAILYLRKNSELAEYLVNKMIQKKSANPWILFNYTDKKLMRLRNYPCTFFDPLWTGYTEDMPYKEFSDFFRRFGNAFPQKPIHTHKEFFQGAFAYHWHNQWKVEEYEDSFYGVFNHEFNQILGIK
jgi:hypothetical protein